MKFKITYKELNITRLLVKCMWLNFILALNICADASYSMRFEVLPLLSSHKYSIFSHSIVILKGSVLSLEIWVKYFVECLKGTNTWKAASTSLNCFPSSKQLTSHLWKSSGGTLRELTVRFTWIGFQDPAVLPSWWLLAGVFIHSLRQHLPLLNNQEMAVIVKSFFLNTKRI